MRAHSRAALAWGIVVGLLAILVLLQLLNPGVFGDGAWISIGRLRFARQWAVLAGLLGNLVAIGVYTAVDPLARVAERWKVGAVVFAVLNVVIGVPAVVMAWAAILPPARVIEPWFLVAPVPSSDPIAILMLGSTMGFLWLLPGQSKVRSIDVIRLTLVGAGFGLVIAMTLRIASLTVASWAIELLSNIALMWGCLLALRALSANPMPAPAKLVALANRVAWGFTLLMPVAAAMMLIAPFSGEASDDGPRAMTASERQGRAVFIREGCATCHQAPWNHSPGPDLSREFGARSADWHLTHLFSPRAVSPTSVMPSFARLFDSAPDQPKQEARDLVAYLETLGRREELSTAPNLTRAPPPSRALRAGEVPALLPAGDRTAGLKLFGNYCVGCHGMKGEGDGPAAAGLRPKPANLAAHRYTREQIVTVLWRGVAGTSMPAWRDQPRDRIASLVEYVAGLGEQAGQSAGLGEQAGLRTVEVGAPADAYVGRPALQGRQDNDLGARVYAANCSQCHGERGGGDGFSAASLAVAPANFQRQQPSLGYALRAIAVGVEGTPMAPWTSRLSEDEVLAVAHYVRSFYTGGAK